jgi:predicted ATP-grasp superfamily ATP-dependent carboligase
MFADEDLHALCSATRVTDYPHGFEALLRAGPMDGWMYTGALENYPRLVERLEHIAPLWGNPAHVLQRIRDPLHWARVVRKAGLPCPAVQREDLGIPLDGTWLRKPLRSAGGAHIAFHRGALNTAVSSREYYFQRHVAGTSVSALYVASHGTAFLLGVTKQLVGRDWSGGDGFCYSGSIGPLDVPASTMDAFTRVGNLLAKQFELRGLFGVDAIVNEDGVWPVEVNPRFPASAELYDWALGISTVDLHLAACQGEDLKIHNPRRGRPVYGKAIVFADRATTINASISRLSWQNSDVSRHFVSHGKLCSPFGEVEKCHDGIFQQAVGVPRDTNGWPAIADVPAAGSKFCPGDPVVTVFAVEETEEDLLEALQRRVAEVRSAIST